MKSALKAMPIKTDRRDAEGIARLLQMGWFRPVHCKTVSSQEKRALLTSRKSVKDAMVNMELSLRGVLRNFGLKLGQVSKGCWETVALARRKSAWCSTACGETAPSSASRARRRWRSTRHRHDWTSPAVNGKRRKGSRLKVAITGVPSPGRGPDDARRKTCSPNRPVAVEHVDQIGTREPFWTWHHVGGRRADHRRKREPGDGHIPDRSFSGP